MTTKETAKDLLEITGVILTISGIILGGWWLFFTQLAAYGW